MPLSALVPISRKFITKDLNNRITIVKKIYKLRVGIHASLFTAVNVVPHIDHPVKLTDDLIHVLQSIQI